MHTQGATVWVAMHFNEADTELLGGSVFKWGKYVGWNSFGTNALLGPMKGTQIVEHVHRELMCALSHCNSIYYCSD